MQEILDIIRLRILDPYESVVVKKRGKDGSERNTRKLTLRPKGQGGISIPERLRYVELVFLWGMQTAQLASGTDKKSPGFVVDVRMNRKPNSTKIDAWFVYRQDGTVEYLKYTALKRPRKWKAAITKKSKRLVVNEADDAVPPLLRNL